MSELVVIPHGNESKKIREIQKKLAEHDCFFPIESFFVRFEENSDSLRGHFARIKRISSRNVKLLDKKLFLIVSILFENTEFLGKIFLGFFLESKENHAKASEVIEKIHFDAFEFPVFKIAEAEFKENQTSLIWKVTSEKWIKPKKLK